MCIRDRVLDETSYAGYIRDGSEEAEERWGNVLELRNVAAEYDDHTLAEFLADVALVSDVDSLKDEVDAPTLLTLHSAKGLEFPIVFITGLEDGLLPHSRSFDEPDQMAEERRLMYVGLTRAENRIFLTHAFRRTRYGDSEPSLPSRFLGDIPPELISGSKARAERGALRRATTWPSTEASLRTAEAEYQAGQRVLHAKFGEGMVVESRQRGGDEIVTVAFEGAGVKRLMAGVAKLQVLE